MQKKLNLAVDVINSMLDWFNYHNFVLDDETRNKLDKFLECEVKDEN